MGFLRSQNRQLKVSMYLNGAFYSLFSEFLSCLIEMILCNSRNLAFYVCSLKFLKCVPEKLKKSEYRKIKKINKYYILTKLYNKIKKK